MADAPATGVVVMAYGTPRSPDDVEAYYTHIRRGRPPTDEQLADLTRRYDAIGGTSPLAERTEAQRAAIERALGGAPVALGQKHASPFIEDAVADLLAGGAQRIAGLVLAPHFSRASVGEYHARALDACGDHATYTGIDSWHDVEAWLDFQARAVRDAVAEVGEAGDPVEVLFTAHSLPERVLADDPYAEQLEQSARAIAAKAGIDRWSLAWQSAGRTPEPWRGPDVLAVIAERAGSGVGALTVCPQGFTSDHLEVLYDLDIEAAAAAEAAGLRFARTRSVNDDALVMAALAERVREALR